MVGVEDQQDWKSGWPAAAERVEVWGGRLVFELRGFWKSTWTDDDVAAAQRCYPGQLVTLSDSRALLFVDPPEPGPHPGELAGSGDPAAGGAGTASAVVMPPPVLAADLTFAAVNGGRVVADVVNWEHDSGPVVGQRVLLAGGGAVCPEAVITAVGDDGTIVLQLMGTSAGERDG